MFILKILFAPLSLALTLFTWLCAGLISCSAFVFKLASALLSLLAVAVLITYSIKNGIILLVIALLISPLGFPMLAVWLLGKTRDTYVAYRKAGYSKKFLAEHESEITLHKAAKKFFDDQGIQKLPTVKSLQAEYATLMAEKKTAYAEYRKAREDMKELLTAKANIDRILELEEDRQDEREKNLKIFSKSCDQSK